ncbi:hypothetical protein Tco_0744255, partial [Tanacetum coccineum]
MIAPLVDVVEGQIDAPMMDMEEDLAVLFHDDDFEDDASDGFVLAVPPPSVYEVGGPSTTIAEGTSFPQVALGLPGSDTEIAPGVIIGDIGLRVLVVEGQMQVMASQMIQAVDRVEQVQALQADVQQRDTQIQQLQTTITEMSSRESTLMRCILGLEKWIVALERRPPGP